MVQQKLEGDDYRDLLSREKRVLNSGAGGIDWGNERFLANAAKEQDAYVDKKNKQAVGSPSSFPPVSFRRTLCKVFSADAYVVLSWLSLLFLSLLPLSENDFPSIRDDFSSSPTQADDAEDCRRLSRPKREWSMRPSSTRGGTTRSRIRPGESTTLRSCPSTRPQSSSWRRYA
jgi:hypothetical protein